MGHKALLVGCGNIGSRHLQALAGVSEISDIDVVEVSAAARAIGLRRLAETRPRPGLRVRWLESLAKVSCRSDLAIVATTARARISLMRELLAQGHQRIVLEKPACQSPGEYDALISMVHSAGAQCWVNTPRRYMAAYREIRNVVQGQVPISLTVTAGNAGLGCNAIHYLDLFCWLSGEYAIEMDAQLWPAIFPNKRGPDFVEFAGTLHAWTSRGDHVTVTFLPINAAQPYPVLVQVASQELLVCFDEGEGHLLAPRAPDTFTLRQFQSEHVSETTRKIVRDVLHSDGCALPTIDETRVAHTLLFRIMLEHLARLGRVGLEVCPVT